MSREAARYIETHGMVKRTSSDPAGRVCATEALRRCTPPQEKILNGDDLFVPYAEIIWAEFPERYPCAQRIDGVWVRFSSPFMPGDVIVRFNDHPSTTLEEVVMVLEKGDLYSA